MPSTESAARELRDRAALWSIGEVRAYEVVRAACDALVAGLDGPALVTLAACTWGEADRDVPELLPAAFDELGLAFPPADSDAGREAAARALAHRMLAGRLTPRELTSRIHVHFGHRLPPAGRLAELDDEYDLLPYGGGRAAAEVDAEVRAEALRITGAIRG
ncbi:hypothetical protein ACPC54_17730 [Kitasatospora sp. NPDC094028]